MRFAICLFLAAGLCAADLATYAHGNGAIGTFVGDKHGHLSLSFNGWPAFRLPVHSFAVKHDQQAEAPLLIDEPFDFSRYSYSVYPLEHAVVLVAKPLEEGGLPLIFSAIPPNDQFNLDWLVNMTVATPWEEGSLSIEHAGYIHYTERDEIEGEDLAPRQVALIFRDPRHPHIPSSLSLENQENPRPGAGRMGGAWKVTHTDDLKNRYLINRKLSAKKEYELGSYTTDGGVIVTVKGWSDGSAAIFHSDKQHPVAAHSYPILRRSTWEQANVIVKGGIDHTFLVVREPDPEPDNKGGRGRNQINNGIVYYASDHGDSWRWYTSFGFGFGFGGGIGPQTTADELRHVGRGYLIVPPSATYLEMSEVVIGSTHGLERRGEPAKAFAHIFPDAGLPGLDKALGLDRASITITFNDQPALFGAWGPEHTDAMEAQYRTFMESMPKKLVQFGSRDGFSTVVSGNDEGDLVVSSDGVHVHAFTMPNVWYPSGTGEVTDGMPFDPSWTFPFDSWDYAGKAGPGWVTIVCKGKDTEPSVKGQVVCLNFQRVDGRWHNRLQRISNVIPSSAEIIGPGYIRVQKDIGIRGTRVDPVFKAILFRDAFKPDLPQKLGLIVDANIHKTHFSYQGGWKVDDTPELRRQYFLLMGE